MEYLIKSIKIEKALNKNLERLTNKKIIFSNDSVTNHLILTGENGSGKTVLLKELDQYIIQLLKKSTKGLKASKRDIKSKLDVFINYDALKTDDFVYFYYRATLNTNIQSEKICFEDEKFHPNLAVAQVGEYINDYLIKLYFNKMYHSQNDKDLRNLNDDISINKHEAFMIMNWITEFEQALAILFNCEFVKIKCTYKDTLVKIDDKNFTKLIDLSDGYKSIFKFIGEILIRASKNKFISPSEFQGLILIDEIENHLHIGFQRNILPFLTVLFPKIQFVISTHSPFVVSSIPNATIYDLENELCLNDLTTYDYKSILLSHFKVNDYSLIIETKSKELIKLYKESEIRNLNDSEIEAMDKLKEYFMTLDESNSSLRVLNHIQSKVIEEEYKNDNELGEFSWDA